PAGGMQAFAVVASSRPLPSFEAWQKKRGPVSWRRHAASEGGWKGNGEKVTPLTPDTRMRGRRARAPASVELALTWLCRSLHKAEVETVEVIAFGVRAKAGK